MFRALAQKKQQKQRVIDTGIILLQNSLCVYLITSRGHLGRNKLNIIFGKWTAATPSEFPSLWEFNCEQHSSRLTDPTVITWWETQTEKFFCVLLICSLSVELCTQRVKRERRGISESIVEDKRQQSWKFLELFLQFFFSWARYTMIG